MEKAFYRINEVAEIIGLGKSLTYKLVSEGHIPSVYLAGSRARRIHKTALENWIKSQSNLTGEGDGNS
ncbi:MAG: helix-turn-helix domain-containing protein [Fimbriimonadaceae bacterium]|nr:helix-turn-helix domain-containing protein [Fimbriimonadaceae bacterium]